MIIVNDLNFVLKIQNSNVPIRKIFENSYSFTKWFSGVDAGSIYVKRGQEFHEVF